MDKILVLVFVLGVLGLVSTEDACTMVNEEHILCLESSQNSLNLECPEGHNIVVRNAQYKYNPGNDCPTNTNKACVVNEFFKEVKKECNVKVKCSMSVPAVSETCGNFTTGRHLLHVSYKCEPVFSKHPNARAIDMCYKDTFTGTLSFVNTHPLGLLGNFISDTPCIVVFDVPKNTQLEVRVPYFQTQSEVGDCDIRMEIWNKYKRYELCSTKSGPFRFPCTDEDLTYGLRFVTKNPEIGAIQVVSIAVGNNARFTIRGNQTDIPPSPEDLLAAEKTTPAIGAIGGQSSDPGWFMANSKFIIGGCMGGAVLIIVITVLVVVFKYRRDSHSELNESETSSTLEEQRNRDYNFVTEIYVDGEKKSKLMGGSLGKHASLTGKENYGQSFAKSDKI